MTDINKETYETIKKLILESEWGRSVKNDELEYYLVEEVHEFIEAIAEKSEEHILEEAADVFMILMYILIKNRQECEENSIDEVISRINGKLRKRYSVFFDETFEYDEEENWKEVKYIEKEVTPFLFCTNKECRKYGKMNVENMVVDNNKATCTECGNIYRISEENLLLRRSRNRRKIVSNIEGYFFKFLKNSIVAEEYFSSYLNEYLQFMRYAALYPVGYNAFQEYISEKCDIDLEMINEFFMIPLRNYVKYNMTGQKEILDMRSRINDMLLRWLNVDFERMYDMFGRKAEDDEKLILDFYRKIISLNDIKIEKNYNPDENQYEAVGSGEKEGNSLKLKLNINTEVHNNPTQLKLCIEGLSSISETLTCVYAIIIESGLYCKRNLVLEIYGESEKKNVLINKAIIKKFYPMITSIKTKN